MMIFGASKVAKDRVAAPPPMMAIRSTRFLRISIGAGVPGYEYIVCEEKKGSGEGEENEEFEIKRLFVEGYTPYRQPVAAVVLLAWLFGALHNEYFLFRFIVQNRFLFRVQCRCRRPVVTGWRLWV